MKKINLLLVFLTVFLFLSFGQSDEQEEIDYLLFLPNSSSQFADEARARTQLDNIARYLRSKTLTDAQIFVYGYTADVANDIDSGVLSVERARFVINELQRRGIPAEYFSAPVGYGSVDLWGNNINEAGRSPNRRVRILFENIIITPEVVLEAEEDILAFEAQEFYDNYEVYEYADYSYDYYDDYEESSVASDEPDKFNWWWLLLLLLPLLLIIWPKQKQTKHATVVAPVAEPNRQAGSPQPIPSTEPSSAPVTPPAEPVPVVHESASVVIPAAISTEDDPLVRPEGGEPKYYRLTEEEIRNCAYEIFAERGYQHGCHDQDWLNAIGRLFAKYEAQGYIVLWP